MANRKSRCPLCEQPNHCALSNDPAATSCWCQQASFSKELLAKANADSTRPGQRCVCQNCAEKAQRLAVNLQQLNSRRDKL